MSEHGSAEARLGELVGRLGLRKPTPQQAAIATAAPLDPVSGKPQPLLVVAGAGSGKTETLSMRALFLNDFYGVPAENILGLTFTRKAAGELEHRLRKRLGQLRQDRGQEGVGTLGGVAQSMTYNGFALALIQEFGAHAGIDPAAKHLGEAASWQLMNEVAAGWSGELPENKMGWVVERALSLRGAITDQGMELEEAEQALRKFADRFDEAAAEQGKSLFGFQKNGLRAAQERLLLLPLIAQFEERKAEMGAMDFSDQVSAALRIVRKSDEARNALRERHQAVFLDEFQDTSVAQLELLSALFSDHPVTAVGDPNQAIYGWRGASAASLDKFHPLFNKRTEVPKKTLTLSTAWRNDRSVLEAANQVAAPLALVPPWVAQSREARETTVALTDLEPRPNATLGRVIATFDQFEDEEFKRIVGFAKTAQDAGQSVAVLARKNSTLTQVLTELRRAGVKAQLASGEALLQHPAVNDLRSALEVTADVGRSSSLGRLLANLDLGASDLRALSKLSSVPTSQHGERPQRLMLEALLRAGEEESVPGLTAVGHRRLKRLAEQLSSIRDHFDRSLVEQVEHARSVLGLDALALADPASVGVSEVLDQFTQFAATYQGDAQRATMAAFLEFLAAADVQERGIALPNIQVDPKAVQLMTIHGSKGLEWDAVAVVGLNRGTFPKTSQRSKPPGDTPQPPESEGSAYGALGWWTDLGQLPYPVRRDHEHLPGADVFDLSMKAGEIEGLFKEDVGLHLEREERRLAYVALTRARSDLLLTGSWYGGGQTGVTPPSKFLTQAGAGEHVTVEFADSPTRDQVQERGDQSASPTFPRKPGPSRKAAELAAAEVLEKLGDVRADWSDVPPASWRERVLSRLTDQDLAGQVRLLLEQRDRTRSLASWQDAPPHQILREVAKVRDLSVTEVAQFEADPQAVSLDLLRPVPKPPGSQAALGSAFHTWVETHLRQVAASTDEPDDNWEEALRAANLSADETKRLQGMQEAFKQADFLQGLHVVALEVPFWLPSGELPVRGRVDAVFQDASGDYLLVDWKTGTGARALKDERLRRYYATQLRHYLAAWESTAAEESVGVRAQLVFVSPQGLRTISLEQLEAED